MASSYDFTNQLLLITAPSPGDPDDHWTLKDLMFSKYVFEKFPKQCPRLMFIGLEHKTEAQVMKRYNELVADHRKKAIEERRESPEVVVDVHDTSSKKKRNSDWRWSEDEHRRFLEGLEKIGKGNWREISRYHVLTKNPQQVASHAQKYYLRLDQKTNKYNTATRMRRSIHDIITRPPEDDQYVLSVSEHAKNHVIRPAEDHVNYSTNQLIMQQQQQLAVSEEEVNQAVDLQQQAVKMQIGSDENPIVLYRGRPGLEGYYNFEDLL
ncbi:unnamed protein product [Rhodiola kirilowii]